MLVFYTHTGTQTHRHRHTDTQVVLTIDLATASNLKNLKKMLKMSGWEMKRIRGYYRRHLLNASPSSPCCLRQQGTFVSTVGRVAGGKERCEVESRLTN